MLRALIAGATLIATPVFVSPALAEIDIEVVTSPGGITAWLVEEPALPFVAMDIRIDGGANLDREGKRGAVNLMTATLEEGAGDMDARAFQTAREGLAAQFGFEAYDDAISITATMLNETRDEAVDLLREALVAPRFDEDAVERVRGQVLSILAQDAQDPSALARNAFNAQVWGDHPYATDTNGTAESVAALTREDLVQAHADTLVASRVYVGVVGDITPEELGPMLDHLLGDLPADGPALPERAEPALDGGVTVVDYPSPQSVAIFGLPGIDREDPDWFAAFVLDHIVGGGGFESRLMDEVREKRGLTYGIGTSLVPKDFGAIWLGSVASGNGTIAEALSVMRDVWADVAANGVSEPELAAAKTYLTGEYPLRFDGNGDIASILVAMQMLGLPTDYVVNRNAYVEAVTMDDIRRVAARLVDPAKLTTVVVGQPEGLGDAAADAAGAATGEGAEDAAAVGASATEPGDGG